jgi:large subunit ribosomal protein L25
VIYGDGKAPESITLSFNELNNNIHKGRFLSTLYNVDIDGRKERVLPRDVQFDVVTDAPLHVDFLRIGKGKKIPVMVPVHFTNEPASPGLKRGGVLNIVRHEVELLCPADEIPESIEIDLTGLEIGDGMHISSVTLPDGVVATITDRDFTIATIAAPTIMTDTGTEDGEAEGEEESEGEDEE